MSDLYQSFVHVTYGRDLVGLRSGCLFQASTQNGQGRIYGG